MLQYITKITFAKTKHLERTGKQQIYFNIAALCHRQQHKKKKSSNIVSRDEN